VSSQLSLLATLTGQTKKTNTTAGAQTCSATAMTHTQRHVFIQSDDQQTRRSRPHRWVHRRWVNYGEGMHHTRCPQAAMRGGQLVTLSSWPATTTPSYSNRWRCGVPGCVKRCSGDGRAAVCPQSTTPNGS